MKNEGTPKRVTYSQLEKQNRNGNELLFKVTRRIADQEKVIEALIGAMAIQNMDIKGTSRKDGVIVSKALISELVDKYSINVTETEDKLSFNLKVIEKEVNNDESSGQDQSNKTEFGTPSSNDQ